MRVKKVLQHKKKNRRMKKAEREFLRNFAGLCLVAILCAGLCVGSRFLQSGEKSRVYAASEADGTENLSSVNAGASSVSDEIRHLPTGIAGIVSGVIDTPMPGSLVNRIGTSCEEVMVGQRVQKVESRTADMNVSESMEMTVADLGSRAESLAETPKLMSDEDYDTLLRIVEAEAGTEDVKGRIMVANVIMNRVKHEEFPDTVTEVVWEYDNGVPQFSPIYDGSINRVTISDETREAVRQVLEGVDYSEGALFFIQRSAAESHNISWFEKDLKKLFQHGVHEFYTYPDEKDAQSDKNAGQTDVVLAKGDAES